MRFITVTALLALALAFCAQLIADEPPAAAPKGDSRKPPAPAPGADKAAKSKPAAKHVTQTLRGKVVWVSEALARKHGIRLDADAESLAALETADGELVPLMKEDRGRGFWKDGRLRDVEMELVVRRYEGVPLVQVIRVYRLRGGKKFELDYWCDVCAIQMFELKDCECCQGPTRIRERAVEEKK